MSDNMRVYATTNKSAVIRPGYPQIGNGQTVYVEGAESSAGHAADWVDWKYVGVSEAPGGELAETNFTVRTVWTSIDLNDAPVRLEPVTAATNTAGTVVNPAGVPLNGVAVYRVEVVPEGIIPESDIHWSKNNNNVTFYSGKDWGREAYVRGLAEGDFTLEVTIGNMPAGYRPHIHGRVLTPTVTPIYVYIICDANGTPAVSTDTVNAWVAEANRIYRQAAMSFYVASVEHVVNTNWLKINNYEFDNLCSYASNTGGLELYCVSSINDGLTNGKHSRTDMELGDPLWGMAVASYAQISTLAHEIGHACGLADLYHNKPGGGRVSKDKLRILNWSGGKGTGYHAPTLAYRHLTYRAIMNSARPSFVRADIPLDYLTAIVGGSRSPISVGLNQMKTRTPKH